MVKLEIIIAVLLFTIGISALSRNYNSTNSPSLHALGSGRHRGNLNFRSSHSLKDEGLKTRRTNSSIKFYRYRNIPQPSPIMEQMKGKAIFYYKPDEKTIQNSHSSFERKSGQSFKINEKTVNDTIREVEDIMRANPQIPRLSRQEMIDILQNISNSGSFNLTESDGKNSYGPSREEYIRSLMLVMPFNTNNLSESMIQDLYTKPPITEIIDTTSTTPYTTQKWKIVVGEMSTEAKKAFTKEGIVTAVTEPSTEFVYKTSGTTHKPYSPTLPYISYREKLKNKQLAERQRTKISTTTENPSTVSYEPEDIVSKISITTEKPTTIFQYPESTLARLRAKTTQAPFVVTATSVNPKPFKRIPSHVTIPSPLKKDNTLIRDDVKELLASIGLFPLDQPKNQNESISTTKAYIVTTSPAPFPMDVKQGADTLSPEMQTLLKSFGLLDNEIPSKKDSGSKQTTQTPIFSPPPPEPTVDIGSYSAFKPLPIQGYHSRIPSNRGRQKMGNDMKEFLTSFGLLSDEEDKSESGSERIQKSRKVNPVEYEEKIDKAFEEENDKDPKTTSAIDLSIDTDMLPEEMKNVLHTLGFAPGWDTKSNIKEAISKDSTTIATPVEIIAPDETTISPFLSTKRVDHQLTMDSDQQVTTDDTIPTTTILSMIEEDESTTTEGHIFNPVDAVHNNEDLENIHKLLKTVHLLTNGTAPEAVKSLLEDGKIFQADEGGNRKEKMASLEEAKNPPDPLSVEELVYFLNAAKNEVKRQESANASVSENVTNSTEETSTPATIEASETGERNPSIEDLAASFGGSSDEEEDSELPAPPSRPNGLYFLLDWNSFLEVGEDSSRVNLRFNPKIGDSRNFLPVTVP